MDLSPPLWVTAFKPEGFSEEELFALNDAACRRCDETHFTVMPSMLYAMVDWDCTSREEAEKIVTLLKAKFPELEVSINPLDD